MRVVLFLAAVAAVLLAGPQATAETAAEKAMAQQIGRELKESGQLHNYRIGVKYQDGVVWLGGTVANASQRHTAVRLTEQMDGVSRVICQLQVPGELDSQGGQQPNPINAFDAARAVTAPGGPSPVVHAFANNGAAPAQRNPALVRSPSRPKGNMAGPRGNMPLPSRRPANGSAGPGLRQVSTQGVYHAGGPYAQELAAASLGGAAGGGAGGSQAVPVGFVPHGIGRGPSYENAMMPGYAWPSYASYPNYAALTYPKQYSPTAWPYIGPFYPYPQVPLAWRKASLEWDDGWWFLDFSAHNSSH
jgi:hypothetical protein